MHTEITARHSDWSEMDNQALVSVFTRTATVMSNHEGGVPLTPRFKRPFPLPLQLVVPQVLARPRLDEWHEDLALTPRPGFAIHDTNWRISMASKCSTESQCDVSK